MTELTDKLLKMQIVQRSLIRGRGSKGSIRFADSKEGCATTAYSFNLVSHYAGYDERDEVADEIIFAINAIPEAAAEIDRLTGEVSRQQEAIEVAMETATLFDPESVKHAKIQMMTIAQTLSEAHDPQFRTDFQALKDRVAKADALAEAVDAYGNEGTEESLENMLVALTAYRGK